MTKKVEEKFELPEASRFSEYLRKKAPGVKATGLFSKCGGETWTIEYQDETIGRYILVPRKEGETDRRRYYVGRIPGFINHMGSRQITLDWDNMILRHFDENGAPSLVEVPWGRTDLNDIPFP